MTNGVPLGTAKDVVYIVTSSEPTKTLKLNDGTVLKGVVRLENIEGANVRWFKFSKRDYEIYLEWLSLQQNHLQFTGYSDDMGNIRFLFRKVEEGKFNAYSDTEYLTKETCGEYLKSTKEHYFSKHV